MSALLRVVIVDDEAPARQRLRDLLADCAGEVPHTVAGEAADGRSALDVRRDKLLRRSRHSPRSAATGSVLVARRAGT